MTRGVATRWLTYPVFGWRDVGVGDLALALGLSRVRSSFQPRGSSTRPTPTEASSGASPSCS